MEEGVLCYMTLLNLGVTNVSFSTDYIESYT